jgi:hypothetical protein
VLLCVPQTCCSFMVLLQAVPVLKCILEFLPRKYLILPHLSLTPWKNLYLLFSIPTILFLNPLLFFFKVLEFELRALSSTILLKSHPQSFLLLVYFLGKVFFLLPSWDYRCVITPNLVFFFFLDLESF